jgi:predicted dehydrogenase
MDGCKADLLGSYGSMPTDFLSLRVLLAGCGSIGHRHARVLRELSVRHLMACDPNKAQLSSLVNQNPGIETCESFSDGLRRKPDAVFILTPPKLHIPMAIEAIRAGCDVFLEKPIADTLSGIDELRDLARAHGKRVMIGLCFRFHSGILEAKEYVDGGAIGRLISVRALMGEHLPDVRPDFKSLFTSQYSGAFDLMHDLDLALWFAGQPVRGVKGLFGTYSDIDIRAPDLVEILIDFENRCMANVHLDFFQRPRRRTLELIGTGGVAAVEFANWERCTVSVFAKGASDWQHHLRDTRRDDMFIAEDKAFLLSLVNGIDPGCGIDEACKSLRVVLNVQGSADASSGAQSVSKAEGSR